MGIVTTVISGACTAASTHHRSLQLARMLPLLGPFYPGFVGHNVGTEVSARTERHMKARVIIYIAFISFLLLVPLVAMRFSNEVNWGLMDFVVMGLLLTGVAVIVEFAIRKRAAFAKNGAYFLAVVLMLMACFVQLWANIAVGIVGSEGNAANILFYGVVGVALAGTLVARLESQRMMVAMLIAAAAQVGVFLVASAAGWGTVPVFTLVLTLLWAGSAMLFRKSANEQALFSPSGLSG